jgi:hypothetical protein
MPGDRQNEEQRYVYIPTAFDRGQAFASARLMATLATLAVALAGCSGSSKGGDSGYGTGDPKLAAPAPGGSAIDPFLSDGHAVLRALDAIAAKSGNPLRITSIDADRINGLTVQVQEPKNHVNVDQYVIAPDGTMSGPTPVKLASLNGGPVTAALVTEQAFDPHLIPWARLAQTAHEAIEKSNFPDARVSEWEFGGIGPDSRKYMYLEAARGRPAAILTPRLTIVEMRY